MRTEILCCAAAAILLAACGGASPSKCDPACRKDEICDADTGLCFAAPKNAPGNPDADPANVPDGTVSLSVEAPLAGALVDGGTVFAHGDVNDPSGLVSAVTASIDGSALRTASLEGGEYEVKMPLPSLDFAPVTLTVSATGPLMSAQSSSVSFTVDNLAPRCAIDLPTALSVIGADAGSFMATVEDGDPNVKLEWIADGVTLPSPRWPFVGDEPGRSARLSLRATDTAGNVCEQSAWVYVDNVPPVVTVDVIPTVNATMQTFHVTGTVTGEVFPGTSVTATLAASGMSSSAPVVNGRYDVLLTPPVTDATTLVVDVVATDAAGNVGRASRSFAIDTLPPAVSSFSPAENARLGIAQTTNGIVHLTWTATDAKLHSFALSVLRNNVPVTVTCSGTSASGDCTLPPSSDNPAHYQATLAVTDDAANTTTVTNDFDVDNVAPTYSITPADNARLVSPELSVQFAEGMSLYTTVYFHGPPGVPLTVSQTTDNRTFTVSGLAPGTAYSFWIQIHGVDSFGNVTDDSQIRSFFTTPAVPANNALLESGSFSSFDAQSDDDGVPVFALLSRTTGSNGTDQVQYGFYRLDETDAGVVALTTTPVSESFSSTTPVTVTVNTAERLHEYAGYTQISSLVRVAPGVTNRAFWAAAGNLVGDGSSQLYIPSAAGPSETVSQTSWDIGSILTSGGAYYRPANPLVYPDIAPQQLTFGTNLRWQLFQNKNNGQLWEQSYVCGFGGCAFQSAQLLAPTQTVAQALAYDQAELTAVHLPGGRRLYAFHDNAGNTVEHCEGIRDDTFCSGNFCPTPSTTAVPANHLRLGSANSNNLALGTRIVNGQLQLVMRDATVCSSSWQVVASMPSTGVIEARPVMFGARRGALYLTAQGLRAWVP